MDVLRSIPELSRLRGPLFLAIGVFDGVHLGHQAVISTSARAAKSGNGTAVVVTFDPHPEKVLRPDSAPHLLTATRHKVQLIRSLGVEHLLVIHFDKQFAATSPEQFVEELVRHSKPLRQICVGHEWSFGKGAAGNLDLLERLGAANHFDVIGIPPVRVADQVVSSTAIRKAIQQGDFAAAARMLGRDYTILGTVVGGDKMGKKLGFPTANLSAHSEQFPPNGVYVAEADLDGQIHQGVLNLGSRPTIHADVNERVLEIHLLDFDHDIYDYDVEVRFVAYLRPEQKFDGLDALKRQIQADVRAARQTLSGGA
jgi:riboflavin kinase/FMN adenylyltransferase